MIETAQLTPPATGLAAYTLRGWTVIVFATGHCAVIGAILAEFASPAKALAWIEARHHD